MILIFDSSDVVFVKMTEGNLNKRHAFGSAFETMYRTLRNHERVASDCFLVHITYQYGSAPRKDAPKFTTRCVCLQTSGFTRFQREYLHRCWLIESKALKAAPWPIFEAVIGKLRCFH